MSYSSLPMTLATGTRLGPYEIISPIGAGGMGEVFRAKDTRLDRIVAIKVLPSHLSSNSQFRERFDREARAVSALNHPNICTLHDVGHEDGIDYIVMELLEGESLADRLARGPLPVEQVLRYGAQVAEGLDKAHRQGIVHRDLKPGNVMITKSGAKLLDFGLAKSVTDVSVLNGDTNMATAQKPLTEEGTILGTFQYMAPEQLEGEVADSRTDIFALGALLYEMATGRRAFQGKTRTSLIAAIVSSEPPPISQIQPLTPPALEHVIRKCLAKDRDDRWQSAHDIAEELKWISEAGSQAGVATPLTSKRKHRERIAWLLNIVTAVVAVAATWGALELRKPEPRAVESVLLPPENLQYSFGPDGNMAFSPDGRRIVILAGDGKGKTSLFVRSLDSGIAQPLGGTEGASYPFWSPDGAQIAFFAEGKLKTIDSVGGPVQTVCDAADPRGASWGASDTIVFTPSLAEGLFTVQATGGSPVPLLPLMKGETGQRFPYFLPDGVHFRFLSVTGDTISIDVGSTDRKVRKRLIANANSYAMYSSGYLLFLRNSSLMAQGFDLKRLELNGPPFQVAQDVSLSGRRPIFSVSSKGDLAYQKGKGFSLTQLVWVDRAGKEIGPIAPPALFFSPRISHDGRRVAVDISSSGTGFGDIWIFDLVRKVSSRLTYHPANESGPVWSSDDREVTYFSERDGGFSLYRIASSGTGQEEKLGGSSNRMLPNDVSLDGQWLVVTARGNKDTRSDIWLYSNREKKPVPWLATTFLESCAQLSPDGKWMAYQSDESGRDEIYVRSFPDSREKWLVSSGGGVMPAWRSDGRELYYISLERKMTAVAIKLIPAFEAGSPVPLFDAFVLNHFAIKQYDLSSDGTRFLLNRVQDDDVLEPITLVQNWKARVRKR